MRPDSIPDYAHNLGFWLVDDELVFSKPKSVLRAQERNTHNVSYYYYDHIFSNIDWTIEPSQNLENIYAQRAHQLREKYDYIVMLYSGGSDSSNALKTFLYNNIKLDEVCTWYTSYDEYNCRTNQEIIHAASGMLDKVANHYGIHIRKLDDREYLEKTSYSSWEFILGGEGTLSAAQLNKQNMLFKNQDWLKLVESGKSVALITGMEKPRIFWDSGWQAAFLDVAHGYNWEIIHTQKLPITLESFYLTPDAPHITIKQSHVLKKYITQNYTQDFIENNFSNTASGFNQSLYFKLCRTQLYPYWNENTFTIGKDKPPLTIKYQWVWDSKTDLSETYLRGLDYLAQTIDPYFLNGGSLYNGFVGNWSRRYKLDV